MIYYITKISSQPSSSLQYLCPTLISCMGLINRNNSAISVILRRNHRGVTIGMVSKTEMKEENSFLYR